MHARERLIEAHAYLAGVSAVRWGRSYHSGVGLSLEDLVGAGYIGLVAAVDEFDRSRGTAFKTWAITKIRGAILEYIREADWIPRSVRAEMRRDEAANRSESLRPVELRCCALETRLRTARCSDSELFVADIVPDPEEDTERLAIEWDERMSLLKEVGRLPAREAKVIRLRYGSDKSFKEIGARLGCSESRAYQLHRNAIARLKLWLSEAEG
jgi:RNA polymerase sigma factor for flagellar operon FliA